MYLWIVCMYVYVYVDIHIHRHCLLFCVLDYLGFCNQTKLSFRALGRHLLVPQQAALETINLALALTWRQSRDADCAVLCSCHEAWVTKVFTRS